MSKIRHRARGGGLGNGPHSGSGVGKVKSIYGNPDVISSAKQRKEGGKVVGKASGGRLDRKRGGKISGKSAMSSAGGGSADKSPFFT